MDQAGIRTRTKIIRTRTKIRVETSTEDKEPGLTVTTTWEAETIAEITISAEATHKTRDSRKEGTTNPHGLSNRNDNQDHNSLTSRTDNRHTETGLEARGAEEGKIDPEENENLTTTGSQIIDIEVKGSRNTIRETPPRPLLAKSRTTTQTGQRERGLRCWRRPAPS